MNTFMKNRYVAWQIAKRDLQQRYVESYLGVFWIIAEPLINAILLSTIFAIGFNARKVGDFSFFVYMFTGSVAYNYFSTSLREGADVIRTYSFLVRKVNFNLDILPFSKIISSTILHFVVLSILMIILLLQGLSPSIYWLQVLYYLFCMNMLALGLISLFSSLAVFVPDVKNIVTVSTQFLFYVSPVFWDPQMIPEKWLKLLKLNPMFYIVQGYRESFLYEVAFWEKPAEAFLFWLTTLVLFLSGNYVFRKLKPQFADVL